MIFTSLTEFFLVAFVLVARSDVCCTLIRVLIVMICTTFISFILFKRN